MDLEKFVDEGELAQATSLNPSDLENEMLRMASLYTRFGLLTAKARRQRDAAKANLELVEAKLDGLLREKHKEAKVTEARLRAELVQQSKYQEAHSTLIEANGTLSALETVLMALQMKRDMLVQLNKNAEREWQYQSALSPEAQAEKRNELVRQLGRLG